jgi:hypothetical protein
MANETIDFVENEEENIDLRKMFFLTFGIGIGLFSQ